MSPEETAERIMSQVYLVSVAMATVPGRTVPMALPICSASWEFMS